MQTTENSMEDAAKGLLMQEEAEQDETPEVEAEEVDTTDEDDGDEQAVEEDAEADPDDTEDDDAETDEDDDAEEEIQERPQVFKVKVDGQETEVTLEELTQSFSGQKYIQKGMQEAAAARKEAEAVYAALQQDQARLAGLYQQITQDGVAKMPKAPDARLASEDPIGYIAARAQFDEDLAKYQQQQSQMQEVSQQSQRAQQAAMQTYLAEQAKILAQEIPEYSDPVKGKEFRSELRSVGQEYGYSDDELAGITDARAVKVLRDAASWRKLQAAKGKVTEKASQARPVVRPKAQKRVSESAKTEADLRARVKRGDSMAAAELLMLPTKGN